MKKKCWKNALLILGFNCLVFWKPMINCWVVITHFFIYYFKSCQNCVANKFVEVQY